MTTQNIVDAIKKHDWTSSWLDFSVYLYERDRLVIAGGHDLCYYHQLEIILESPSYIRGVMDWPCDLDEDFIKEKIVLDNSRRESVLEFYSYNELVFKVISERTSVNFDTVFYYKRDNLNIGERLAYWVK